MIDLEQIVTTTWNQTTRTWYENKGYVFTKYRQKFDVKAKDLYTNSIVDINATCDYCGMNKKIAYCYYNKSTKGQTEKYACKNCSSKKMEDVYFQGLRKVYFQAFLDLCNQRGYKPLSTIDDYKNRSSKLSFICPKHGVKTVRDNDFMNNKTGCSDCGHELVADALKMSTEEVIRVVESKNGNKIKNPQEYVNVTVANLVIVCGSCGNDFVTSLSSIINADGRCRNCVHQYQSQQMKLSKDEVEYRINSVNGNRLLNSEDYIRNDCINLNVLCSCGNTYLTSICNYDSGSNRCPVCTQRTSKGEIMIGNILDSLNIEYITEKTYDDCKDKRLLPFDFYLPQYNSIIEFDGVYHFEPVFSNESFEKTKLHDKMKNNYCFKNNIPLLRIPYWESNNAELMIRNFLKLDKYPKIIHYHKNPYKD